VNPLNAHDVPTLRAALRGGTLPRQRIELAALCGHESAARVVSAQSPPVDTRRWLQEVSSTSEDVRAAAWLATRAVETEGLGTHAWAKVFADRVMFMTFTASGPPLQHYQDGMAVTFEAGVLGWGTGSFKDRTFVEVEPRPIRPEWCAASRSLHDQRWLSEASVMRRLIEARLAAWALRPLHGPSRVEGDLDVLLEPRVWWDGPLPWQP
jgi:hypothetical protein